MNVSSLELSKTLWELSGWEDTDKNWYVVDGKNELHCGHEFKIGNELVDFRSMGFLARAYDLGYLLRKLPSELSVRQTNWLNLSSDAHNNWEIMYEYASSEPESSSYIQSANTPEDAACKLLCELIKQGVIKP